MKSTLFLMVVAAVVAYAMTIGLNPGFCIGLEPGFIITLNRRI